MTYRNGQIPDASLVTIDRGARLLPGPAADWAWITAEVERRHGWRPRPTGSFDGYRPLSGNYYAQTETFLRRYSARSTGNGPYGDVRWWNGVRYVRVNGAAAAVPGTSNHGWGAAVDVADLLSFTSSRYAQFAAVAAERRWTNTEGRSIGEHWHWVAVSTAQAVKNGTYTGSTVPDVPTITAPTPIEEDDMPYTPEQLSAIVEKATNKAVVDIVNGKAFEVKVREHVNEVLKKQFTPEGEVSDRLKALLLNPIIAAVSKIRKG